MRQICSPRCGISVDVDSIASHLRGYGVADNGDVRTTYEIALPRILSVFAEEKARATFFVIVNEARQFPEVLQRMQQAGHEIACHSLTHPVPFPCPGSEEFLGEINGAKIELEKLLGRKVFGFRAPGWDLGPEMLKQLLSSGYRYDASQFPSWMLHLLRRAVAKRGGLNNPAMTVPRNVVGLTEIPISCSALLRIPYYHTMKFLLPSPVFSIVRALTWRRAQKLHYIFHAADFLALTEDGLDPRIARHPGMALSLREKLDFARDELQRLRKQWDLVPLHELLQ